MSSVPVDLPGDVTRILQRIDAGDCGAMSELLPVVYRELRAIAGAHMASERPDHTLQPTALVHEAYLRLADRANPHWNDRRHFYRAAGVVMRSILINHARDRGRQKRGGGLQKLGCEDLAGPGGDFDLVALDEALVRLEVVAPQQAELVELRFFAALTVAEAAEVLGVSQRTVEADWSLVRAWLMRELDVA